MTGSTVYALITARGGAKGLPRKNTSIVAGKPLLSWSIAAARGSSHVDRVLLSTDDETIASVGRNDGAEVPFVRPPALATDDATHVDVALHLLQWLEEHDQRRPAYLLLLQPTSPLRRSSDIDAAIALAMKRPATPAVVSVARLSATALEPKRIDRDGTLADLPGATYYPRRQDAPEAYCLNGAIFLIRPDALIRHRKFVPPGTLPLIMPAQHSVDIDTAFDMYIADFLLRCPHENSSH